MLKHTYTEGVRYQLATYNTATKRLNEDYKNEFKDLSDVEDFLQMSKEPIRMVNSNDLSEFELLSSQKEKPNDPIEFVGSIVVYGFIAVPAIFLIAIVSVLSFVLLRKK